MKPLYFSRNELIALLSVLVLFASLSLFVYLAYTGVIRPVPSMYPPEPAPLETSVGCYGPTGPFLVQCEPGLTCECPVL